ncbi:MAG: HD domain-containing protein [Treponema sp.]|nr:HD domain-containing protein [Treponema sp.]
MKHIKIPDYLKKMSQIFTDAGFDSHLVGGAVRDSIMGIPAHDYDVATNATPQQVTDLFKKVIPTGIEHGTVTVLFAGEQIEVTTFRTESDYSDGRHPDKVEYAGKIEEDLSRRDFTMNAIAARLSDGVIVDPYGGQDDIKAKVIRTVGIPGERFMEDGLRPIRALRFAAQLKFSIEENTYKEIFKPEIQNKILSISIERFHDEFVKMLKSEKPSAGLKLMEETGILKLFIPEFEICRGCIQGDERGFHDFDVLDHLFYACDGAPKDNSIVRIAALFHDIGKPAVKRILDAQTKQEISKDPCTQADSNQIYTFYNHESAGTDITEKIMKRLKFSNDEIKAVTHLIKEHMFHYESNWSDAAVRRFIIRAGYENLNDLFDLRVADIYGMHNNPVAFKNSLTVDNLVELKDRIKEISDAQNALSLKDLKVNGKDLMNIGIPAGKQIGIILNRLFETVIDSPAMNDREKLLEVAQKLKETIG